MDRRERLPKTVDEVGTVRMDVLPHEDSTRRRPDEVLNRHLE